MMKVPQDKGDRPFEEWSCFFAFNCQRCLRSEESKFRRHLTPEFLVKRSDQFGTRTGYHEVSEGYMKTRGCR